MGAPLLGKHFAGLQSASTAAVAVAAAGSVLGAIAALVQAAPVWLLVLVAVAPWLPILALELVWTYRHYRWLALFCVLLVTQTAYLLHNVVMAIQVHVLQVAPSGVAGSDVQPQLVHVIWTSWAVAALLVLLLQFRRNLFLWIAFAVSLIDGVFAGEATDVQMIASVVSVVALNLAFAVQLSRTYDAWLARAFPDLPERLLIDATARLEEVRLRPGERLEPVGERLYIVTSGTGSLVRPGPGGHEILLRVLAPGAVITDPGTLKAESHLELLAVPANVL